MMTIARMRNLSALLLMGAILLSFSSCPVHVPPPEGENGVRFRITNPDLAEGSKTVWPNDDPGFYTIATLQITGTGPQGQTYSQNVASPSPGVFNFTAMNLAPGTWSFVLIALNSGSARIAQTGIPSVIVSGTGINEVDVVLNPVLGADGALNILISWVPTFHPDHLTLVIDPELPVNGSAASDSYSVLGMSGFSTGDLSLPAGMYRVTVFLYADPEPSAPAWGRVETVYIAPGRISPLSILMLDLSEITALPDITGPALTNGAVLPGIPLALSTTDPTAVIVYTTDGSDPSVVPATLTPMNGTLYNAFSPPDISSLGGMYTTVSLRARAFNRWGGSETVYRSYDISDALYADAMDDPFGTGSRADPSSDLQKVIDRAARLQVEMPWMHIPILLAKGVYQGGMNLPDGVDLSGNWISSTWSQDSSPASGYTISNATVIHPPDYGAAAGTETSPLAGLKIDGQRLLANTIDHLLILGPKSGSYSCALAVTNGEFLTSISLASVALKGSGSSSVQASALYARNSRVSLDSSAVGVSQTASTTNAVFGIRGVDARLALGNLTHVENEGGGRENFGLSLSGAIGPLSLLINNSVVMAGSALLASVGVDIQNRPGGAAAQITGNSSIHGGNVTGTDDVACIGAGIRVGNDDFAAQTTPVELLVSGSRVYGGAEGPNQYALFLYNPTTLGSYCVRLDRSLFLNYCSTASTRFSAGIYLDSENLDGFFLMDRCRVYSGRPGRAGAQSFGFYHESRGNSSAQVVLRNNLIHAGDTGSESAAVRLSHPSALVTLFAYLYNNTLLNVNPLSRALILKGNTKLIAINNLMASAPGGDGVALSPSFGQTIDTFQRNAMFCAAGEPYSINGLPETLPADNTKSTFASLVFTAAVPVSLMDFEGFSANLTTSPQNVYVRQDGLSLDSLTDWAFTDDFDSDTVRPGDPYWSIGAQEHP